MVIEKAVSESDVVVVCLSTQSVSKEGFVQREVRYAYDIALEKPEETIFLIPLRLEECVVPRKLKTLHWVDYFGSDKNETYSTLLEALGLRYSQKLKMIEVEPEKENKAKREFDDLTRKLAEEKLAREKAEQEANAEREARIKVENEQVVKRRRLEESKAELEEQPLKISPQISQTTTISMPISLTLSDIKFRDEEVYELAQIKFQGRKYLAIELLFINLLMNNS